MSRLKHTLGSTRTITFFYFFLLVYTIAALVWWGIVLHAQNVEITQLKRQNLELLVNPLRHPLTYAHQLEGIRNEESLRRWQFIGEGSIFLLVILFSAGFVFQAMRREIRLSRQQHNFMMSVTHELKSPIAAARLNLETVLKRRLDPDKQTKLLENSLKETNRLNHLINNMLLASQFESHQYRIIREPLDLSALVAHALSDMKDRFESHPLESMIEPHLFLQGDSLLVEIVLSNLVENAIKYSPKGAPIAVELSRKQTHRIQLKVEDQAETIPAEERQKIFEKFYRIGNENTRKSKGTGLGLYLTKRIVEQHKGTIAILDRKPEGNVFVIEFPEA